MISLGSPKVNFQYESPDAHERLLAAVRQFVSEEETESERQGALASPVAGPDNNQLAFQVCSRVSFTLTRFPNIPNARPFLRRCSV